MFHSRAVATPRSAIASIRTGTSSNATALFELRVLDAVTPQRIEVVNALEAFRRFFENHQLWVPAGFDVQG